MRLLLFGLREQDLNLRPSGYEPDELPDCSIPRQQILLYDILLKMSNFSFAYFYFMIIAGGLYLNFIDINAIPWRS